VIATPEPDPLALSRLVRDRLTVTGLSYQAAAERGGLPKATIANLATKPVRNVPQPETMARLAYALGIPLQEVHAAVARGVGLELEVTTTVKQRRYTTLELETAGRVGVDPETVRAVTTTMRLLRNRHRISRERAIFLGRRFRQRLRTDPDIR